MNIEVIFIHGFSLLTENISY